MRSLCKNLSCLVIIHPLTNDLNSVYITVLFLFISFTFVVTGTQQTCNMPDLQNIDQDRRGAAWSGFRWRDGLVLLRQLLEQGQIVYSLLRR